jgi:hypothetical protein
MKSVLAALFGSFLLFCSSGVASTVESARVTLKKPAAPGGQEAVFLLGTKDNYSVNCQKGDQCMGMGGPVGTGWYCYGFLNALINGQSVGTNLASSMLEAEQDSRAIVDSVWRLEAADVRVRFLGLPGRDFLFCEMTIEPRQKIESVKLTALCFPAYFTSCYGQREEARYLQTPSELIRQAEGRGSVQLAPTNNWWLLYGDDYFDVAKTKESDGPCAMMVLPEGVSSITVSPPAYGMTTTIAVNPEARKVRMAFWKMKGGTNAEAAKYFRANGEAIRKELAALDFTPASVKAFDLPGITAEIDRVVHSEAVGADFQKKAADILAGIKAAAADLAATGDGIKATEQKLQLLNTYASFIHEARLAEILASLDK